MEQIERSGLYFRKSTNKKGMECFVAKIKSGDENLIVIANTETCGMKQKGRYDVRLSPLRTGRGYFVTSAVYCFDRVTVEADWNNYEVRLLINGVENKLKKVVNGREKYIPLVFSCENFYAIDKVVANIREKIPFLQLDAGTDMEYVIHEFRATSEKMDEEFMRYRGHMKGNTPMAEKLKNFKPSRE